MKTTRFNLHCLFNEEWYMYVSFLAESIRQLGENRVASMTSSCLRNVYF